MYSERSVMTAEPTADPYIPYSQRQGFDFHDWVFRMGDEYLVPRYVASHGADFYHLVRSLTISIGCVLECLLL